MEREEKESAALEVQVQELRTKVRHQERALFIFGISVILLVVIIGYRFWVVDRRIDQIIINLDGLLSINDSIIEFNKGILVLLDEVQELLLGIRDLFEKLNFP